MKKYLIKGLLTGMLLLGMMLGICANDTLYAATKTIAKIEAEFYPEDDFNVGDEVKKSDFVVKIYYEDEYGDVDESNYDVLGTREFDLVLKYSDSNIMEYPEDKAIITYYDKWWIAVDIYTVDSGVEEDPDIPRKLLSISADYEGDPVSVGGMASKRDFIVKATYRVYYTDGSTGRVTEELEEGWVLLAHTITTGENDLTITYAEDGVKKSCTVVVKSTGTEGNWIRDGEAWRYRYDDNTYLIGDWVKSGGKWYYMDEYGYMVNRCKMQIDDATYYFDDTGVMQTGWVYLSRNWYYFGDNGKMRTGWVEVGGQWYYLDTDGIMLKGWKHVDGQWYFLDEESGAMRTGWLYRDYAWFFLDPNGMMRTGWVYTGGKWYFMDYGGAMLTNTWVGNNYVDGSGAWVMTR